MDQILSANVDSPFVNTMTSLDTTLLSPKLAENYPAISTRVIKLFPEQQPSGTPFGKQIVWEIPSDFIVTGMCIENILVVAGDNSASDARIGERVFSNIELKCRGTTIFSQSRGASVVAGLNNKSIEKNIMHTSLTTSDSTLEDTTTNTCYTPIYCEMFDKTLDSTFLESLTLEATFSSQSDMGLATGAGLTSSTHYLYITGFNMDKHEHDKLIQKMYPGEEKRGVLSNTFSTETYTLGSSETTLQLNLREKGVVNLMGMYCLNSTGDLTEIGEFTFSVGGQPVFSNMSTIVSKWNRANLGIYGNITIQPDFLNWGGHVEVSYKKDIPTTIDFRIEGDSEFNSGALPFSGLQNPFLELSGLTASSTLYIVYRKHVILSQDPSDGSVSVSVSI